MLQAYINAHILDGLGNDIVKGTLLIEDEHILQVGEEIDLPPNVSIYDCHGDYITPGLIDVHTHLGVHEAGVGEEGRDFNETSEPVTPHIRAIDGVNPMERAFQDARESGVTTVQIMPGSANVIGGEMAIFKTAGHIVDEMIVKSPSGMKGAFGENPKRIYSGKKMAPVTRMGIAALMRQTLMKARDYQFRKDKGEILERDLRMEQLLPVLKKEIPLRTHAHRSDDIMTAIRIADEFKINVTIEHCTEGHLIADKLAEHGVQVSVGPTMSTRSKVELADKGYHTMVALEKHDVPFSITTDHPVVGIDYLTTTAAHAIKNGLSEVTALKALTSQAARHLSIEAMKGSLEKGKDADFVIWSGHPFDVYTTVKETFIEGKSVYKHTSS
ncbi:amidohydrolase [Salipaludibacillus agaradhaerens]|uniref:amidohydrolase n=1 Tax=Salipaludibacillus agaradhaerens TaxID=76935 RepID=UPI002151A00B|nr:amidohydrolase [Salipaludibacillus agaradhaerens]MCR6105592.1 amidohydrolase [Salipaludibacillus agaradhaerens]MCR6117629.1 amidohydrolase [Salipaludibacillus agaradhaerens]UJW56815.1 amidohydrolase [Bacillus sp. A116_S68]